jgi:NADH-quinone oxidoreductase subunit N
MLAYSSIGHAGYLLVAIAAGTGQGAAAMVFYLLVYTLATFGAFAVVIVLTRRGTGTLMIDELSGLWSVRPWLALGMGVIMLALLGFPIFGGAGFFAKWYVLQAALQSPVRQTVLAVTIVITSVISAGYYMYVVMVMFMRARPAGAVAPLPAGGLTRFVLVATVVLLLVLGFAPDYLVRISAAGQPGLVTNSGAAGPTTASRAGALLGTGSPPGTPTAVTAR